MGFQVVQGTPYITWVPVDNGETLRVGQLVTMAGNLSGAINLGAAAGLSGNNSIGKVPWGLVIGTNEKVPLYDSSYKAEYTTQVTPHAQTREL